CRAGEAVELVLALQLGGQDGVLPEEVAVAPVEAEELAFAFLLEAGGDEDAVAPDGRRGVALAGDGHLPGDVVGLAPFQGHGAFVANAVAAGAAPAGPVAGVDRQGKGQENPA